MDSPATLNTSSPSLITRFLSCLGCTSLSEEDSVQKLPKANVEFNAVIFNKSSPNPAPLSGRLNAVLPTNRPIFVVSTDGGFITARRPRPLIQVPKNVETVTPPLTPSANSTISSPAQLGRSGVNEAPSPTATPKHSPSSSVSFPSGKSSPTGSPAMPSTPHPVARRLPPLELVSDAEESDTGGNSRYKVRASVIPIDVVIKGPGQSPPPSPRHNPNNTFDVTGKF